MSSTCLASPKQLSHSSLPTHAGPAPPLVVNDCYSDWLIDEKRRHAAVRRSVIRRGTAHRPLLIDTVVRYVSHVINEPRLVVFICGVAGVPVIRR